MAIDDFHHFKMMKRNKEVRRIEGRPNAENSARESERNL
jgi:hypothetical protein